MDEKMGGLPGEDEKQGDLCRISKFPIIYTTMTPTNVPRMSLVATLIS